MIIKQLSVFLENKTGRINEVTRILGEEGVNLRHLVWLKPQISAFFVLLFLTR